RKEGLHELLTERRNAGLPALPPATPVRVHFVHAHRPTWRRRPSMRNGKTFAVFLLFLITLSTLSAGAQDKKDKKPFDIIIRNGHIIDGTGSPWYSGDLGIRDGKIAAIGNLAQAAGTRMIDAHGLVVAPGFIDMLGQSELTVLVNPRLPSKIFQGITTEITGEGGSSAPLNDSIVKPDDLG